MEDNNFFDCEDAFVRLKAAIEASKGTQFKEIHIVNSEPALDVWAKRLALVAQHVFCGNHQPYQQQYTVAESGFLDGSCRLNNRIHGSSININIFFILLGSHNFGKYRTMIDRYYNGFNAAAAADAVSALSYPIPKSYVVVQTEIALTDWFSSVEYNRILFNALQIWDYSISNRDSATRHLYNSLLKDNTWITVPFPCVSDSMVEKLPSYMQQQQHHDTPQRNDHSLLFVGCETSRRVSILNHLRDDIKRFGREDVISVTARHGSVFTEELHTAFYDRSKIVLNIHTYDPGSLVLFGGDDNNNSSSGYYPLETSRCYAALERGCIVISEWSSVVDMNMMYKHVMSNYGSSSMQHQQQMFIPIPITEKSVRKLDIHGAADVFIGDIEYLKKTLEFCGKYLCGMYEYLFEQITTTQTVNMLTRDYHSVLARCVFIIADFIFK